MASILLPHILPIPKQLPPLWKKDTRSFPSLPRPSPLWNPRSRMGFAVFAEGNGLKRDDAEGMESGDGGGDLKRGGQPAFNLRWRDLLYPDPENMVAIGLTGLLTWASVQVLWQLFFISIAILLAALKWYKILIVSFYSLMRREKRKPSAVGGESSKIIKVWEMLRCGTQTEIDVSQQKE